MPLVEPKLDSRKFEQIFRDARLRIPQYTPEWTDFNDSDPGITLLQLYAWLTEIMLFEMNRLPELNYVKFLKILGLELASAQPATAHLTFTPDGKTGVVSLPRYTRVEASPPDANTPITFEIEGGLDVTATPLQVVQVFDGARFSDVSDRNADLRGQTYRPFGWLARPGNMLYLGFAVPKPEDLENFPNKQVFPERISLRVFLKADTLAGAPQNAADSRLPPKSPVKLTWEARREGSERWWPLDFEDGTTAFMREGYIRISGPQRPKATIEGSFNQAEMYWLRCVLQEGSYPAERVPEIDFIRANVTEAFSLTTEQDELVGISEGVPDQTFQLARRPVQPKTLKLEIRRSRTQDTAAVDAQPFPADAPDRPDETWELVDDLLASQPNSAHFTLNATSGEIHFGDGKQGKVPPAGLEIIARSYRYGGGTSANVAAGLIGDLRTSATGANSLTVTNERPAVGGADEQKVEDLMTEAPRRLRSQGRAVTAEDFQALAEAAGGVAKATALPLVNPNFPGVDVPGAVTVVIVPEPGEQPPEPSADLIRSVGKFLDDKRPLATELYVQGPTFLDVRIRARVEADPLASFGEVKKAVLAALKNSPQLDPYQQCFGQSFYPTNLYNVILNVPDVQAVSLLTVSVRGAEIPAEDMSKPHLVPKDGLLYGTDHEIEIVPPDDNGEQ